MVYLITYDLNGPGKDYSRLYTALQQYDNIRDPGLDSVWFVSTTSTANEVSNHIRQYMDANDKHVVTLMRAGEHQGWLLQNVWDWINARL